MALSQAGQLHRLRVLPRTDPPPKGIHEGIRWTRVGVRPLDPEYRRHGGPVVRRLPQGRRNPLKEKRRLHVRTATGKTAVSILSKPKLSIKIDVRLLLPSEKNVSDGMWTFLQAFVEFVRESLKKKIPIRYP